MFSYEPYRKLKEIRDFKIKEIIEVADFSSTTLAKLTNDESVTMETLDRLCVLLKVPIESIVRITDENGERFEDSFIEEDLINEVIELKKKVEYLTKENTALQLKLDEKKSNAGRKMSGDRYIVSDLASYRKQKGLTQDDVATHVGVSKQMISYWEKGAQMIAQTYLDKLIEVLDISEDAIQKHEK